MQVALRTNFGQVTSYNKPVVMASSLKSHIFGPEQKPKAHSFCFQTKQKYTVQPGHMLNYSGIFHVGSI